MKNKTITVKTIGKPSLDALTKEQRDICYAELLAAFIEFKREKAKVVSKKSRIK